MVEYAHEMCKNLKCAQCKKKRKKISSYRRPKDLCVWLCDWVHELTPLVCHSYSALYECCASRIVSWSIIDLRDDKHYLADHPGLVPVTSAQVWLFPCLLLVSVLWFLLNRKLTSYIIRGRSFVNKLALHTTLNVALKPSR